MDENLELTRRQVLALLGMGAAGAAVVGPWGVLQASAPPDGPEVPVPTTEAAVLTPPPAPTVADLAASLGWDVEAMFRYVADDVDYQPYAGALRGAQATLWSKGGNSVDKALLLGALLTEAGASWRFALGELDADAREVVGTRPRRSLPDIARRLGADLLPHEVFVDWSGEGAWRREGDVEEWYTLARERAQATYAMLADALSAASVEPPPPPEAVAPGTHVWVQVAAGSAWIDLDPTLAGSAVGEALAEPAETTGMLSAELFHAVTLRLVAEIVTGGVPTMTTVVEHTVRAVDVAGVPIYVVHAPATIIDVGGALAGQQRYRPVILVGSEMVRADVFVALEKGEGISTAFGEDADAEGQTLAEWLEVDVVVPGKDVRTERRLVFDRVAGRRDAGDLRLDDLPPIELTHIDDDVGDVYLPCASPFVLAIASARVPWASMELPADPTFGDLVARSATAVGYLRELCYLDHLETLGNAPFADEPVVVALRQTPAASDGDAAVTVTVDLIHIHEVVVGSVDPRWGLRVGAIRHAAERMALLSESGLDDHPAIHDASVGRVFERATEEGVELRVFAPGDEVSSVSGLSSTTRVLIETALAAGRHVVIPARAVELVGQDRIGWWEYDAMNGAVLDRFDNAGHATMAEYAVLLFLIFECGLAAIGIIALVAGRASGRLTEGLRGYSSGVITAGGACLILSGPGAYAAYTS